MTKKILLLVLLLHYFPCLIFSQTDSLQGNEQKKAYFPTIGFGVGTFSFYGDIKDYNYKLPLSSNFGYKLYVNQKITDYLSLNFSALFGEIKVDERKYNKFYNFDSDIFAGGLGVEYNFDQFLPKERVITPFVSVGIEMLEFSPKSDIKNRSGQFYNIWSDGTIRSLPENSPNAENAQIITRDYVYESELSEENFNSRGFEKKAISFPVGAGIIMKLNDQFDFKLGASYYFTNSDYIDGFSPATPSKYFGGNDAASSNDKFLFASFSISYNFQKVPGGEDLYSPERTPRPDEYIDYAEYDNSDFDKDGVIDFLDKCPNTPSEVEVDSSGCAIDTDKDGIADFKDQEINSPRPMYVDENGVSVTDEMIYQSYLKFIDSTGRHAEIVRKSFSAIGQPTQNSRFRINLGTFNKNESPEQIELMLNVPDLTIEEIGNKVYYTSGSFSHLAEAASRRDQLKEMGLKNPQIMKKNPEGVYQPVNAGGQSVTKQENPTDEVYFRIQLGAFKNKPSSDIYANIPSLYVSEQNGIYRYFSGYFTNYNDAAKHKVQMIIKGYSDAFVVGYKQGKKVSLNSLGVETINPSPLNE